LYPKVAELKQDGKLGRRAHDLERQSKAVTQRDVPGMILFL
jgi:hypothetical protein